MQLKGQAATEYLVIFAVVLLVALVALTYIGSGAGGSTQHVTQLESDVYWKNIAKPVQISAAASTYGTLCGQDGKGGYQIVLKNADPNEIEITGVYVDGASRTFCAAGGSAASFLRLAQFESRLVTIITNSTAPCTVGETDYVDFDFSFNRSGIATKSQNATKPVVLICTNSAPVNESTLNSSSGAGTIGCSASSLLGDINSDGLINSADAAALGQIAVGSIPAPSNICCGDIDCSGSITADDATRVTEYLAGTYTGKIGTSCSAAFTIDTNALPGGTAGVEYSAAVSASCGASPYTWSASGLPSGLSIDPNNGTISGTPLSGGVFPARINVIDPNALSDSRQLSITISSPSELTITTSSLSDATAGIAYSASLAAIGGASPYTWLLTSDNLPAGLTFSREGVISGTPTSDSNGTYSLSFLVQDTLEIVATKALSLTVQPAPEPLTITTSSLANATEGRAYSATLAATGGNGVYNWSISSGSLPAGLSLANATGIISGTPSAGTSGSYTVTYRVNDTAGNSTTKALTLAVGAALNITTASPLANATVGAAYSASLSASGGSPPYTWSNTSTMPSGISIANATGIISGTPSAGSNSTTPYTITFMASDSVGNSTTKQLNLTVNAAPVNLTITTSSLANATVGSAYSATLTASGGASPYTWSILSGSLPAGLSLANATGIISGTPSAGTNSSTPYTVNFKVTDSASNTTNKSLSITVRANLSITTSSLSNGTVGSAYSATLAASGGSLPYTWSNTSAMPAGLTLSAAGAISGTPTAAATTTVAFNVTDNAGTKATRSLSITITSALSITTSSLADGTVGSAYSATLAASGGSLPYTWSNTSAMPAGLSISSGGAISGTPTAAGTTSVSFNVTDNAGRKATRSLSITINLATDPLTITTSSLADGTVGSAYSATLSATGGTLPYSWSNTSAMPAGLKLSAAGAISGTPTAAATTTVAFNVTDNAGTKATRSLSITISNASDLAVTTDSLPGATEGEYYLYNLAATGGSLPYTWAAVSGDLPSKLTLAENGTISGIPDAGTSDISYPSLVFQVTDHIGAKAISPKLSIIVSPAGAFHITTSSLPSATARVFYSELIETSGGAEPITITVDGHAPASLRMVQAGALWYFEGTPQDGEIGEYSLVFTATDKVLETDNATLAFSIR